MKVSVILPAAGLGTRMKSSAAVDASGASRKQWMLLEGSPVLFHTIRKFCAAASVSEVVVALRAEDLDWARSMIEGQGFPKPVRVVEGGESRQQSVEKALAALDPDVEIVAVHDAVRPFVDVETIEEVIAQAAVSGAAIVGIVPVDTVKQMHRHYVAGTLNRDRLVLAQTPQVFRAALLREAFQRATEDGFIGTDEASLVERLETTDVLVVSGSDRNIKITRPSDLSLAQFFLAEERGKA
jgi:2-C-methyl-D-erythritol 4-phosphate cytidylyltransferase